MLFSLGTEKTTRTLPPCTGYQCRTLAVIPSQPHMDAMFHTMPGPGSEQDGISGLPVAPWGQLFLCSPLMDPNITDAGAETIPRGCREVLERQIDPLSLFYLAGPPSSTGTRWSSCWIPFCLPVWEAGFSRLIGCLQRSTISLPDLQKAHSRSASHHFSKQGLEG